MRLLVALECENFPAQRAALRAPGRPEGERLGSPVVPPLEMLEGAGGAVLLVDTARPAVLTRLDLPMPSGLAWPDPEGPLWVACQHVAELTAIEPETGAVARRVRHPAFNDLHRLIPRPGGGLIVASSGSDAVIAFDDQSAEVWAWWASPPIDPLRWRAREAIPTLSRIAHPVSLVALGPRAALVSSFHDGAILEIGPERPTRVRLEGLRQPHGLCRGAEGYFVADTGRGRVLRLDEDLRVVEVLAEGLRWVNDLAPAPEGGVFLVENRDYRGASPPGGGPRVLELDAQGRERWRLELDPDWRLAAVLPLDEARARRLGWPEVRVRARRRRSPPAETRPA